MKPLQEQNKQLFRGYISNKNFCVFSKTRIYPYIHITEIYTDEVGTGLTLINGGNKKKVIDVKVLNSVLTLNKHYCIFNHYVLRLI
jgi:hypothetical protein